MWKYCNAFCRHSREGGNLALLLLWCFFPVHIIAQTVMLHPAGDTKHIGRTLYHEFERGVSYQFAEAVQQFIDKTTPQLSVLISRSPRETLEPLQVANFANRCNVALFVSLHFYEEKKQLPSLYIYYYKRSLLNPQLGPFSFIPYYNAYQKKLPQTEYIAQQATSFFKNKYGNLLQIYGPFGIPFKPLVGVVGPCLGIEIGLRNTTRWKQYVEPVATAIQELLHAR